jgi:hypothetical protein
MQADANSQPVQPINPATGMNEQGLATIVPMTQEMLSNSNMTLTMPENMGGSDTNPYWSSGRVPPGAPIVPVPSGGQVIDPSNPNSPSVFNQDEPGQIFRGADGNYYMYVPQNPGANSNVNVKASPTPRAAKSPAANVVTPTVVPNEPTKPETTPTPEAKPTPPARTPAARPTPQPKNSPASTKPAQSGKTEESED